MNLIRKTNGLYPSYLEDQTKEILPSDVRQIGTSTPAMNVYENREEYNILLAAPGMDRNDFKVAIEHDVVVVCSNNTSLKDNDGIQYGKREFCFSNFKRTYPLLQDVDKNKVYVKYENGILYINIPKLLDKKH